MVDETIDGVAAELRRQKKEIDMMEIRIGFNLGVLHEYRPNLQVAPTDTV